MHATTADSPTTTSETRAQAVGAFRQGRRGGRRRAQVDSGRAKPPAARHPRHQRRRPARTDIEEAALRILARRGGQILATARRYAATPEDADDAYQRGLEILLTKAPLDERGGARAVAEDRGQARGLRAAPPARAPRPGHR